MTNDAIAEYLAGFDRNPSHGAREGAIDRPCGGPIVTTHWEDDERLAGLEQRRGNCAACGDSVTLEPRLYGRALRADARWLESEGRRPDLVARWRELAAVLDPDPRQLPLPLIARSA